MLKRISLAQISWLFGWFLTQISLHVRSCFAACSHCIFTRFQCIRIPSKETRCIFSSSRMVNHHEGVSYVLQSATSSSLTCSKVPGTEILLIENKIWTSGGSNEAAICLLAVMTPILSCEPRIPFNEYRASKSISWAPLKR